MIYGIVGVSKNGVIGNGNSIPWSYPEDLKFFRQRTLNKPVVMGKRTFNSLRKPLPNRLNLVLTKSGTPIHHDVIAISDRYMVLSYAQHMDVYIIGGNAAWGMFMGDIQTWLITRIPQEVEGDVLFDEKKYLKHFQKAEDINLETLTVNTYVRKP
jgi:dihydrofolate reductase